MLDRAGCWVLRTGDAFELSVRRREGPRPCGLSISGREAIVGKVSRSNCCARSGRVAAACDSVGERPSCPNGHRTCVTERMQHPDRTRPIAVRQVTLHNPELPQALRPAAAEPHLIPDGRGRPVRLTKLQLARRPRDAPPILLRDAAIRYGSGATSGALQQRHRSPEPMIRPIV